MYYPFLRAKQYELKALREFAEKYNNSGVIVPIVEPVKQDKKILDVAVDDMIKFGCRFALVLNPCDGDFKHSTVSFDKWIENECLRDHKDAWIAAFICNDSNLHEVEDAIAKHALSDVMLIFAAGLNPVNDSVWQLINNNSVGYVVNDFSKNGSLRYKEQLIETNRKIISLSARFQAKSKNADYANNVDEFFTDEPFYYADDKLNGYADYTVLPAEYIDGGMLPYALAIHLTYKQSERAIYVHHFVSDSNRNAENVRGKFKEAAKKVVDFYANKQQTVAVTNLIERYSDPDGYPGLGYLKKLSILNHLELIDSL